MVGPPALVLAAALAPGAEQLAVVGQPVDVRDDEARERQEGHAGPPEPEHQVHGRQLVWYV